MTARRRRESFGRRPGEEDPEVPLRLVEVRQLTRLLAFLHPYRGRLALAVGAVIVAAAMGLAFPLVIGQFVDSALTDSAAGDASTINRIALILLGCCAVQAVFEYIQRFQLAAVGEGVVADLRTRLYAHLMLLSVKFFEGRQTGEITSRLTSDITVIQSTVSQSVASMVHQTLTLIGGIVMLFVISYQLSITVLVIVLVLIVAVRFLGAHLEQLSTAVQDRIAEANAVAEEAIAGIRVVQWYGAEGMLVNRYRGVIAESYRLALHRAKLRALFIPTIQFSMFALISLVVWCGGRFVLAHALTGGALLSFLLYTCTVARALSTFTGLYSQLQEALGSTRRIFEMLDEVSDIIDPDEPAELGHVEGRLTLDDVSFAYADRASAMLRDVTLDIAPGEVVALVGPSGAGKSTFIQLIARFYDPGEGAIYLDGIDIRKLRVAELRSHMAAVPQETHLFSGTIADNIRLGKPEATHQEVVEAATAANAHDFIVGFPDQYDTIVGERGVKLSGGQRQRVAIARALLKDPRILLLDEATNALDAESEAVVQEALAILMEGRTTFIIAHRLSTVAHADRIIVLDAGRIVEEGCHAELVALGGLYTDLSQRQLQDLSSDQPAPRASEAIRGTRHRGAGDKQVACETSGTRLRDKLK